VSYHPLKRQVGAALIAAALISIGLVSASPQRSQGDVAVSGRDVTILVTVHPHNGRMRSAAAKLQPGDFSVREEKRPQRIISIKRPTEVPPVVAVLIQDDLVSRVNNEIGGTKEFIRNLPEGSRVLTAYLTAGTLSVAQDFTTDRQRAAGSLHAVRGSSSTAPFNPYIEVVEALRRFDSQPAGRRIVLLVSDGLDDSRGLSSASPTLSVDLDRAIRESQRRGVAVFTFYAPSVGLTSVSRLAVNYGQGSLNRLADETGGVAFFSGIDFVTFDPYFKELNDVLGRQWLITYRSTNTGSGLRRIEVTCEQDVHLHYPAGYPAAKDDQSRR
jgi:VWFA-related protein